MARIVYFANTVNDAIAYAHQHGGRLLSSTQHPDENHKTLRAWIDGKCDLIVADWSMVTGWQVKGGTVEFAPDFPEGLEREQARGRVQRASLF